MPRKSRKLSELTPEEIAQIKKKEKSNNLLCFDFNISYSTLIKILKS